jgi:hypothetical protein
MKFTKAEKALAKRAVARALEVAKAAEAASDAAAIAEQEARFAAAHARAIRSETADAYRGALALFGAVK